VPTGNLSQSSPPTPGEAVEKRLGLTPHPPAGAPRRPKPQPRRPGPLHAVKVGPSCEVRWLAER